MLKLEVSLEFKICYVRESNAWNVLVLALWRGTKEFKWSESSVNSRCYPDFYEIPSVYMGKFGTIYTEC